MPGLLDFGKKLLPLAGAGAGFALGGPAGASLGLSIGAGAGNLIGGFPEFPLNESDVNRLIDQQMNRQLAQVASGTRRRLIGAGQEGSGSIDAAISDQQNRVRSVFEEQRTKALQLLKQAQHGRDVNAFNQLGQTLGDLSSIGFSTYLLNKDPKDTTIPGLNPQLRDYINILSGTGSPGLASQASQPFTSLQPLGIGAIAPNTFNQPLRGRNG